MAIQTVRLIEFNDGKVYYEMRYDDVTLRVVALAGVNQTPADSYGVLIHHASSRSYDSGVAAEGVAETPIPSVSTNSGVQLYRDAKERLAGFDTRFMWPAREVTGGHSIPG